MNVLSVKWTLIFKGFADFTNASLMLTNENRLKNDQSTEFYPFKMDTINIQKRRYKVLRNCSFINGSRLYEFSEEERMRLVKLLELPIFLRRGKKQLSDDEETQLKEKFLHKLIFAVKQSSKEELNITLRVNLNTSDVPYSYEELHEIALRWLEFHKSSLITVRTMRILADDLKNDRSSYQENKNKNMFAEEIKFVKSVAGVENSVPFNQFLEFLIKGEGKQYLAVINHEGIQLASMSCILHHSGSDAFKAFKDLYDVWFDKDGNKTRCLKTLQANGIHLATMSTILRGARFSGADALRNLYSLWFNEKGEKTQYLKSLEEGGITLTKMSSILNGAGSNSSKAFKDLYDVWFDEHGNKRQCLKSLEEHGISMSTILGGANYIICGLTTKGIRHIICKLWKKRESISVI